MQSVDIVVVSSVMGMGDSGDICRTSSHDYFLGRVIFFSQNERIGI